MGKKRVGRKDFLRSGPAGPSAEPDPAPASEPPRTTETAQQAEDHAGQEAASRFLKDPEQQATRPASHAAAEPEPTTRANGADAEASTAATDVEEKTRGQIVQRHKKASSCRRSRLAGMLSGVLWGQCLNFNGIVVQELKAHKELAKKLGKKRKVGDSQLQMLSSQLSVIKCVVSLLFERCQDEADQAGNALEARHAAELDAWDAANKDDSLADATLVAPTAGLYDLRIGEDDKSAIKVRTL